jgi:hypothetical protein
LGGEQRAHVDEGLVAHRSHGGDPSSERRDEIPLKDNRVDIVVERQDERRADDRRESRSAPRET